MKLATWLAPLALLGLLLTPFALLTPAAAQEPRGGVHWSGDVDETVLVYIHRDEIRTRTVSGKSPSNVNNQVFGDLPPGPTAAFLRHWDGRGEVQLVQEPRPENHFTAIVRIHDPQAGRSHYEFDLGWRQFGPPAYEAPPVDGPSYGNGDHIFRGAYRNGAY